MKVRHTREKFDPSRGVVCLKPFLYGEKSYAVGSIFNIDPTDKRNLHRARQLYDARKLEHLDVFNRLFKDDPNIKTPVRIKKIKHKTMNNPDIFETENIEESNNDMDL